MIQFAATIKHIKPRDYTNLLATIAICLAEKEGKDPHKVNRKNYKSKRTGRVFKVDQPVWVSYIDDATRILQTLENLEVHPDDLELIGPLSEVA